MRISLCSAFCLSVVAVACAKSGEKTVDSSAGIATPPPAVAPAATISLRDVAGTWNMVATPTEGTDTTRTNSTIMATADTTGWTMTLVGRKPVALHVRTDGDSVMTTSEPFESVRRKGVQVTTTSVFRLQGDKLVGTTVAHYSTKGADSVLHLRTEATKAH